MLLWLGIVSAYFQCPQSNPKAAHGHARKALVSSVRLLMQDEEPRTTSLESFFNKVVVQTSKAVQESARATESALNDYVNSGWQVKKRAGQVLPEIRPNTADVVERSNQWLPSAGGAGDAGTGAAGGVSEPEMRSAGAGSAIQVSASPAGSLATEADNAQLQVDFTRFLAVTEPGTFTEGANGEITFASRDALASVVASFTSSKLREMAAAAKALARYVALTPPYPHPTLGRSHPAPYPTRNLP